MAQDLIKSVEKDVLLEQQQRDGIHQLVTGIFNTLIALIIITNSTFLVGFLAVSFFIPKVINALRKRYTYPRIGYAKITYKSLDYPLLMIAAGLLIFLYLISYTFDLNIVPQALRTGNWLMTFIALMFLAIITYGYLKDRIILFLIYGSCIILFVAAVWLFKPQFDPNPYFLLGIGLVNLVYGILTLRAFIRKYPVLKDEN